nr:MAG TPA: hypothetical protein [Caudoviricetes sp.]
MNSDCENKVRRREAIEPLQSCRVTCVSPKNPCNVHEQTLVSHSESSYKSAHGLAYLLHSRGDCLSHRFSLCVRNLKKGEEKGTCQRI